jgi:hypothetical protein
MYVTTAWGFRRRPRGAGGGGGPTPRQPASRRDVRPGAADSARFSEAWRIGGGGVWTTPAYDAVLGVVILGVGNPAPSFDGAVRPGDMWPEGR